MKVWGLSSDVVGYIAYDLTLGIDNLRVHHGPRVTTNVFRLIPEHSRARYARRAPSGRRLKATCYHGFRDFIQACFYNGATRVQSAVGNWENVSAFDRDLPRLAALNIGSEAVPCRYIDTCECGGLERLHIQELA